MMNVVMTDHISVRCQQRGIPEAVIALVMEHGEETDRGYFLSRKASAQRREELHQELKLLERAHDVFVAADGEVAITGYTSRDRQDRGRRQGEK